MRIFGKGKCKFIANFSATMVTSLPSFSVSLSLSLSLSPNVPHAQYRKRFRASYNTCKGMSIDRRRPVAGARFAIGRRPAFAVSVDHGSLRIARTFQDAESEETVFKSARKIPSDHLKDIYASQSLSFHSAGECLRGKRNWPQIVSCVCGHRWGRSLRPVRVRFVQSGDMGIYQ